MLNVDNGYRKIRMGRYEFSPVVKGWLDRCYKYRQLIQLKMRRNVSNVENGKRFTRRCEIDKPLWYSLRDLASLYKECREQTKRMVAKSPRIQKQYLNIKLQDALHSEKKEDTLHISEILWNEAQKKTWAVIPREIKQRKNASVMKVDSTRLYGSVEECTMMKTVEKETAQEILGHFSLARSAPIYQEVMFGLLVYLANT